MRASRVEAVCLLVRRPMLYVCGKTARVVSRRRCDEVPSRHRSNPAVAVVLELREEATHVKRAPIRQPVVHSSRESETLAFVAIVSIVGSGERVERVAVWQRDDS